MSRQAFLASIGDLPYRVRENLDGYVQSVESAAPEIFESAGIDFEVPLRDRFVFVAGVRKLWLFVDSQYQTLSTTLDVLEDHGVSRLEVGSTAYYPGRPQSGTAPDGADAYSQLRRFREELREELRDMQVLELVQQSNLEELLQRIAAAEA